MKAVDTVQAMALRMLQSIYDRDQDLDDDDDGLISIHDVAADGGLFIDDARRGWLYLSEKNLLHIIQNDFAIITSDGVDALEAAKSEPDKPPFAFPEVTYNSILNSRHWEGGAIKQSARPSRLHHSLIGQAERDDLQRLVDVFEKHLDDLKLEARIAQRAAVQVATIKVQLADEPNPTIIREAGRTLRAITEGKVGNLIAQEIDVAVWGPVMHIMTRHFASKATRPDHS